MARSLTSALDLTQRSTTRQPAFRVFVYDVRSTTDTINDVVLGTIGAALTGPREFTDDVVSVDVFEKAGNYIENGIAASTITVRIVDPQDQFDPLNAISDPTGNGRWLRPGNVVRLVEGDERVPVEEWETTFTGLIAGQAAKRRTRAEAASELTVRAEDRSAGFLKRKVTSSNFGQGTSYLTIAQTIAEEDLGLDAAEVDFANWGTQTTGHLTTQFVEEETLVSIAKLMFIDGFLPRFDGEGKLGQTTGIITKSPSRIYADDALFVSVERPLVQLDAINSVCVVGLDANMSEVVQTKQVLATANITTGFFAQDEDIKVYWSQDRTMLAKNVEFKVVQSVRGNLGWLGGEEEASTFDAPGGTGTVGAQITISVGYAIPFVMGILGASYIASAWLPDEVIVTAIGLGVGVTVPIGRVTQAALLVSLLYVMNSIGRGQYEFVGEPFEWVFLEIRACARVSGVLSHELREVVIENHLVQNQTDADQTAASTLFREQTRIQKRNVDMLFDLRLEVDDVYQTANGRKYMIETVKRTLARTGNGRAALEVFEVSTGVVP